MPFVLGLAAGLTALGILAGVSPLLLFAPLLFAGGIALPFSDRSARMIEIAAIALVVGLILLLLPDLPFRLEPIAIRQAMVLAIIVWVSLKIRQRLLRQEWQWASLATASNPDLLQARFVAMLETVPQGIVFIDEQGESDWINKAAADHLGLSSQKGTSGTIEPNAIAQAMVALRLTADNTAELTAQAAEFFSKPQIQIQDWRWHFSDPPKILSLSSTPIPLQSNSIPGSPLGDRGHHPS